MSFGSVLGAIISQKNNKRARSSKIDRYINHTGGKINGVKSHHQPTPEELKKLKQRIRNENRKRQQKTIFFTIAIMLLFLFLFFYFMF